MCFAQKVPNIKVLDYFEIKSDLITGFKCGFKLQSHCHGNNHGISRWIYRGIPWRKSNLFCIKSLQSHCSWYIYRCFHGDIARVCCFVLPVWWRYLQGIRGYSQGVLGLTYGTTGCIKVCQGISGWSPGRVQVLPRQWR